MNNRIIRMFEDIKCNKYSAYCDYVNEDDIRSIRQWFFKCSRDDSATTENIISLMYELYIRENIDFYPNDEYARIVAQIARKYHLNTVDFPEIYMSFRKMVYEASE